MEYDSDLIADFARRTLVNLDRIQTPSDDPMAQVFPVTQLWNSLLGLIVMPHERAKDRIPETPLSESWSNGDSLIRETIGESRTLRDLVRHLRHAVAHSNVEFRSANKEIASMRLWNLPPGVPRDAPPSRRTWEGEISAEDVDRLARLIADTYTYTFANA